MEALWDALEEGALDSVASDHSPSPPAMKALDTGDFMKAWGGISGTASSLPPAVCYVAECREPS